MAFPLLMEAAVTKYEEGDLQGAIDNLEAAYALAKDKLANELKADPNNANTNRANLQKILEENDWNIAKVARGLGVTRRALYMRLVAFGIERKKVPRLAKPLPSPSNK